MTAKNLFLKLLLAPLSFSLLGEELPKMEKAADKFFVAYNISSGEASFSDKGGLSLIGGSGYLRNEVSNIQPINVSLPSISIGCGGIDYRMGSLSTVSSKEMKTLLENIAKGGVSELFVLALDSVSPQIASMVGQVEHWQNQLNSININSCEIGTSLAQGMWPKGTASKERICQQAAGKQAFFKDRIEARHGCRDKTNQGTQSAKKVSDDEGVLGDNFNLAWLVIKGNALTEKQGFVAVEDLHDLYLNISGTILSTTGKLQKTSKEEKEKEIAAVPEEDQSTTKQNEAVSEEGQKSQEKEKKKKKTTPPAAKATVQFFEPKVKEALEVLMNGGTLTGAYTFDPKNEFAINTNQTINIKVGQKLKIQEALKGLSEKIIMERQTKKELTADEKDLIQNTNFPIAKLVSVMAQHSGNLSKNFLSLDQIAGQIAFDQVSSYVESVLTKVLAYSREIEEKQLNNSQTLPYQRSLEGAIKEIRFEKMKNLEQSSNWQNLLQFLLDVERNLSQPSGGH